MRPIDGDALKERVDNLGGKLYSPSLFEEMIKNTPTIEAKPVKHGRWDTHDVVKILASGHTLDGFCQCEACGSIFPFNFSEYSFCPECGARMDGDKT